MFRLAPTWSARWGRPIPNCAAPKPLIVETLRQEEERFRRTLGRGMASSRRPRPALARAPCCPASRLRSTTPMAFRST